MNRKVLLAGLAAGLVATAVTLVISDTTQAAPFNGARRPLAAQTRVYRAEIVLLDLADGGTDVQVTAYATIPVQRDLPDGGTVTTSGAVGPSTCAAAGALKTALLNAMSNQFAVCARQAEDLEQ